MKWSDESDAALLARCAAGDGAAWECLVLRYQALVYSGALDFGLSHDDAGDVFQDVWVDLHRSLPRIREPNALARWLMVATRRLAHKRAVKVRRMSNEISHELVDPSKSVSEVIEELETRHRVERALAELGGRCAELLRLLFLTQPRASYDEISERLGLPIGSIGPTRARCLHRLRKLMEATS